VPETSDHDIVKTITLPDYGPITGIAVFDEHGQPIEKGNVISFSIVSVLTLPDSETHLNSCDCQINTFIMFN